MTKTWALKLEDLVQKSISYPVEVKSRKKMILPHCTWGLLYSSIFNLLDEIHFPTHFRVAAVEQQKTDLYRLCMVKGINLCITPKLRTSLYNYSKISAPRTPVNTRYSVVIEKYPKYDDNFKWCLRLFCQIHTCRNC